MVELKTVNLELSESHARYTLLALRELTEKLNALAHDQSLEEDARFFYANDLMEASRAYDKIKAASVGVFGKKILEHTHETL
jgi:hypothetical protein